MSATASASATSAPASATSAQTFANTAPAPSQLAQNYEFDYESKAFNDHEAEYDNIPEPDSYSEVAPSEYHDEFDNLSDPELDYPEEKTLNDLEAIRKLVLNVASEQITGHAHMSFKGLVINEVHAPYIRSLIKELMTEVKHSIALDVEAPFYYICHLNIENGNITNLSVYIDFVKNSTNIRVINVLKLIGRHTLPEIYINLIAEFLAPIYEGGINYKWQPKFQKFYHISHKNYFNKYFVRCGMAPGYRFYEDTLKQVYTNNERKEDQHRPVAPMGHVAELDHLFNELPNMRKLNKQYKMGRNKGRIIKLTNIVISIAQIMKKSDKVYKASIDENFHIRADLKIRKRIMDKRIKSIKKLLSDKKFEISNLKVLIRRLGASATNGHIACLTEYKVELIRIKNVLKVLLEQQAIISGRYEAMGKMTFSRVLSSGLAENYLLRPKKLVKPTWVELRIRDEIAIRFGTPPEFVEPNRHYPDHIPGKEYYSGMSWFDAMF